MDYFQISQLASLCSTDNGQVAPFSVYSGQNGNNTTIDGVERG